ncbi:hypothetical protein BVC80_8439g12 [Macleaya cordata]|uniref:Uncharacterized protein n=1 Tax=Macleaya cordata TaxID=56857 RepID=A0A200Q7J6_MACCD|nr:hypothetical protein BVC80_8439g12 [Macleaya cordata]
MVRHVLASMSIYLLAATVVPKKVVAMVSSLIANFFWGSYEGKVKRKWVSWQRISRPTEEGGLGVRDLEENIRCLRIKSLWSIRAPSNGLYVLEGMRELHSRTSGQFRVEGG